MLDKRIISFILRHHVLTLATCLEGEPYCANIFYAYDRERNVFVFTSEHTSNHGSQALANPRVAASVVLETKIVGRVRGLQICGEMRPTEDGGHKRLYLKRFPYAVAMKLHLWVLEPDMIKFTDNTLGFGRKLIWSANG